MSDITYLKDADMRPVCPVEGHEKSLLPGGKRWKLVWNDEFDGSALDETKWNYRLNFWGHKSPTFTTEGVEVDGQSHLKIHMVRHGDDFYSAHLQTGSLTFDNPRDTDGFWPFGKLDPAKFMHKYGYYEIRCRLPKHRGWHAAFWLQSPCIGAHPDPAQAGVECDIMENYRQHTEGLIVCGNGWGGYGKDSHWYGHFKFPYEETADGWHYYGVDWSRDGYIFYADGREVGRQMRQGNRIVLFCHFFLPPVPFCFIITHSAVKVHTRAQFRDSATPRGRSIPHHFLSERPCRFRLFHLTRPSAQ